jgi:hypothetical protein
MATAEVLQNELIKPSLLRQSHWIDLAIGSLRISSKLNCVFPGRPIWQHVKGVLGEDVGIHLEVLWKSVVLLIGGLRSVFSLCLSKVLRDCRSGVNELRLWGQRKAEDSNTFLHAFRGVDVVVGALQECVYVFQVLIVFVRFLNLYNLWKRSGAGLLCLSALLFVLCMTRTREGHRDIQTFTVNQSTSGL